MSAAVEVLVPGRCPEHTQRRQASSHLLPRFHPLVWDDLAECPIAKSQMEVVEQVGVSQTAALQVVEAVWVGVQHTRVKVDDVAQQVVVGLVWIEGKVSHAFL